MRQLLHRREPRPHGDQADLQRDRRSDSEHRETVRTTTASVRMAERGQVAAGLLPGLSTIRGCARMAGPDRRPQPMRRPSAASSTRPARRSTPAEATSPSPTSPARWGSPARRCTGISPAPTRCSSRRPCTRPVGFRSGWKHTCVASPIRPRPSRKPLRPRSSGCPKTSISACSSCPAGRAPHTESVTSEIALNFARLDGSADSTSTWAGLGFSDADIDELSEHLLQIIQSFVIDPAARRDGDDFVPTWSDGSARLYARSVEETDVPRTPTTRHR